MATGMAATALEAALADQVHHYMDVYVYETARFLAERLVAHHRTEENLYLLATCYFRAGQLSRARSVLSGATRPENRYLLARCYFQEGKLTEAENALLGSESRHLDDADALEHVPAGAAGMFLLGRVCRRANRRQQAVDCFTKSLEMDDCMWAAYEQLCDLGANLDASQFFGAATCFTTNEMAAQSQYPHSDDHDDVDNNAGASEDLSTDEAYATPEPPPLTGLATPKDTLIKTTTAPVPDEPLAYKTPIVGTGRNSNNHPGEGVKKPRGAELGAPIAKHRKPHRRPLDNEALASSTRLTFSSSPTEGTPSDAAKLPTESPAPMLATRLFQQMETPEDVSYPLERRRYGAASPHIQGRQQLLRLLSAFGAIYQKLAMYLCQEALELLDQLPRSQRGSGWALQQTAHAHFEMANYDLAHETFRTLHRAEPHRMEGLDMYSTTLWHLKNEVELSYLAQQVTDLDKLSCEAWCVAGNCFSLQKEHDTALAFFQRAIQLDPAFTYAYTLSGHEYVANEDFEKAVNCYRHAIRTNPRHYNAWYGLGTIFYRQEKFDFAEYHFKRALEINPRSSLLHCFLGMVQHATQQCDAALLTLARASELQPRNPQARFQRANVLLTLERYEDALEELRVVRDFAPRESSVHFLMGKVNKRLGRPDEAMRAFTTALYYQPKDNNLIKAAMDRINDPDLDDDDRL